MSDPKPLKPSTMPSERLKIVFDPQFGVNGPIYVQELWDLLDALHDRMAAQETELKLLRWHRHNRQPGSPMDSEPIFTPLDLKEPSHTKSCEPFPGLTESYHLPGDYNKPDAVREPCAHSNALTANYCYKCGLRIDLWKPQPAIVKEGEHDMYQPTIGSGSYCKKCGWSDDMLTYKKEKAENHRESRQSEKEPGKPGENSLWRSINLKMSLGEDQDEFRKKQAQAGIDEVERVLDECVDQSCTINDRRFYDRVKAKLKELL